MEEDDDDSERYHQLPSIQPFLIQDRKEAFLAPAAAAKGATYPFSLLRRPSQSPASRTTYKWDSIFRDEKSVMAELR